MLIPRLPILPIQPGDLAGSAMLAASGVLALLQDVGPTVPPGTTNSLVTALVTALSAGGALTVVGTFLMKEVGKRWDAQRLVQREEREVERAERERTFAHFAAMIEGLTKEKSEIMGIYIAREARVEQRFDGQIAAWRDACEAERGRNDTLILQFVQQMSCTVPGQRAVPSPE